MTSRFCVSVPLIRYSLVHLCLIPSTTLEGKCHPDYYIPYVEAGSEKCKCPTESTYEGSLWILSVLHPLFPPITKSCQLFPHRGSFEWLSSHSHQYAVILAGCSNRLCGQVMAARSPQPLTYMCKFCPDGGYLKKLKFFLVFKRYVNGMKFKRHKGIHSKSFPHISPSHLVFLPEATSIRFLVYLSRDTLWTVYVLSYWLYDILVCSIGFSLLEPAFFNDVI